MKPRHVVLLLVLLAVVVVIAVAWRPAPVRVEVAEARRATVVVAVRDEGRTRARDRWTVSSPAPGVLRAMPWRAGDRVEEGLALLHLAPAAPPPLDARTRRELTERAAAAEQAARAARARVDAAEGSRAVAARDLARMEQLAGGATPQQVDHARVALRGAESQAEAARAEARALAFQAEAAAATLRGGAPDAPGLDITAPLGGVVLRVLQASGGPVGFGTPLLELADLASVEVIVPVLSIDAVRVSEGDRATVRDWGGDPLRGHVARVEPAATTSLSALGVEEQRVDVVVHLDAPREAWAPLGDGWRVEAEIEIDRATGVVAVPEGALFRSGDAWAVFVVDARGRARLRTVTPGARDGTLAQVSGVSEGERVVLYPTEDVAPGARVAPVMADDATPVAAAAALR